MTEQKLFTKNFIFLILGQAISLFGNFILKLALSMYILELSGSASIFAAILSISTIPTILLSPLGGIIADRANKRNVMVILDSLAGIFVLCASFFLYKGNDIVIINILLVLLSILGAFETPTVQACIPSMLTDDNITKGNAVVNQIASISYLIAPMIGAIVYSVFGMKVVMYASIFCFFATALLECFIAIPYKRFQINETIFDVVKNDFCQSMSFIFQKQKDIFNILLITAFCRVFVMGVVVVGLPYIVRTVLSLNAKYYGVAESVLAIATIIGSIIAGVIAEKFKMKKLSSIIIMMGLFMINAGIAFIISSHTIMIYIINVICFCGIQIAISIFSIFAVSFIQQKTPNNMIGKIMAYTSMITLCMQPIGQIFYGFLFDMFYNTIFVVLIGTGLVVCIIAWYAKKVFIHLEK
ncbi:MFS transporter [Lachnospiraceae bacterium 46-61]